MPSLHIIFDSGIVVPNGKVFFMDREIKIVSGGKRYMNVASMFVKQDDEALYRDCRCTIETFFSSLAWEESTEIWESHEVIWGSGSPTRKFKQRTEVLCRIGILGLSYYGLFEPRNDLQREALALYRQAQNSGRKNPIYNFLSLYKIFELEGQNNPEKRISAHLGQLRYQDSLLSKWENENPGINFAGRCREYRHGIAHARGRKRLINPDCYPYWKELNQLRYILRDVAEEYMKKGIGISRS